MSTNKILKNNIHPKVDIFSHFYQYMGYIHSLRPPYPLFPPYTKSASKSEQCGCMIITKVKINIKNFFQKMLRQKVRLPQIAYFFRF